MDYVPYDVSPADFVNLVKNTDYVCTDSFHGTVFSIIYKRDFFTFKRFSDKATLSTNSRIDTLLGRMELQDRLVKEGYIAKDMLSRKIDQNAVQGRLAAFREESLNYLIGALEA